MTQEHKELLLKDLCSRLPYDVKLSYRYNHTHILRAIHKSGLIVINDIAINNTTTTDVENIKPMLFPLSSMTKEQKHELITLAKYEDRCEESYGFDSCGHYINIVGEYEYEDNQESIVLYPNSIAIDFCNKHHFDYRGLIPKGLAIDATGLNIY